MRKIIILLSLLTLVSCTHEELVNEFQPQVQSNQESEVILPPVPQAQNNQPSTKPSIKLYKESYLNQRSGIAFWWYSGWGHGNNVNESSGSFSAGHAYYDVNNDGKISVSDALFINRKQNGLATFPYTSKIFTPSQYTSLTTGTTDLRSTILGVSSITINTPVSGTTTGNYYLIAPGYKGQVTY